VRLTQGESLFKMLECQKKSVANTFLLILFCLNDHIFQKKKNLLAAEGVGFKTAMLAFHNTRPAVASGAVCLPFDEAKRYSLETKTWVN
jgi:hypothetical protein